MINIDRERFLSIVNANKIREADITFKGEVYNFYEKVGLSFGSHIADVIQSVNLLLKQKDFKVIELPLKDKEICAFYYDGDKQKKYVILNSSLSVGNNNFALLHEVYHILYRKKESIQEAESYLLSYELNEEESCANTFAGVILLPEDSFKRIYNKVFEVYKKYVSEMDIYCLVITQLMSYFKATYMSVLIRCFELELIQMDDKERIEYLLGWGSEDNIKKMCRLLLLNENFLSHTGKNDFVNLMENIDSRLSEVIERDLVSQDDIDIIKQQLTSVYNRIVEVEE